MLAVACLVRRGWRRGEDSLEEGLIMSREKKTLDFFLYTARRWRIQVFFCFETDERGICGGLVLGSKEKLNKVVRPTLTFDASSFFIFFFSNST